MSGKPWMIQFEKHYGIRLANPAEAKPIFYSVATLADFIRKNRPQ